MYIDDLIEIEIGEDTKHKIIITEDNNLTESLFFFNCLLLGMNLKLNFKQVLKQKKKMKFEKKHISTSFKHKSN